MAMRELVRVVRSKLNTEDVALLSDNDLIGGKIRFTKKGMTRTPRIY